MYGRRLSSWNGPARELHSFGGYGAYGQSFGGYGAYGQSEYLPASRVHDWSRRCWGCLDPRCSYPTCPRAPYKSLHRCSLPWLRAGFGGYGVYGGL